MAEASFDIIKDCARYIGIDKYTEGIPAFAFEKNLRSEDVELISNVFDFIRRAKHTSVTDTLLKFSRLPKASPRTFQNFDFDRIQGPDKESLKSLPSLSAIYSGKNLAFIGPTGLGKTHLAMAFGMECITKELKSYFLKASELNEKFTEARKFGRESSVINGLVKPTCLIVDEIGHCVFDKENTRLFFDMVDRRYSKEPPNCMIFTSNIDPSCWKEFFASDQDLLCSLDRIFDNAQVYTFHGESYRGRKCETLTVEIRDKVTLNK